ncbi:sigma-70 family RNA polymerase sigma factor [Pseudalkalibacillus caeni]|uniref:Sigma-70 family RNA polymerase sigma factor n=1 Tax=Exobacillus caeni TaxID=2574798 RepID=A0A5R9F6C0_9BACL|nr:sigma-70 family RNA polymerase sigma factor [Pseudalkalibacillus caeni]TLS37178.1 sigma-70 family RNA polymerase sigma factor [Pseudalkalibacillus caeni]
MEDFVAEACNTTEKEALIDDLMCSYGQDILQLVFSYVKNKATAEDLTQEIFVKCYKSLHTYKQNAKIRTWLWRIAINHTKDYLKSWYYRNVQLAKDEETEIVVQERVTPEQTVVQRDEDRELAETVMELSVDYREVVYLFYFEELSLREIAEVTGVKENTVKTRLRRAKQLLKERLEGSHDG